MKLLALFLLLIIPNNSCLASKAMQDTTLFEYTWHSRGRYKNIIISKKSISIVNNKGAGPVVKKGVNAHWNSILKALQGVDIKNIPNLKAPSEKRFFDGAPIAKLKIISNGKTYETTSFDHGNPPQELAQLVKEILTIAENDE